MPAMLATGMLLGLAAGLAGVPSASAATTGECDAPVDRVLVLSLPTVTWDDIRDEELPNLERLLSESVVADLSTRSVLRRTSPGDGYATLGAGTRARGVGEADGLGFEVGERYGTGQAAEVFARRTGVVVDDGLFALAVAEIRAENEGLDFGAEVGALGEAVGEHGWSAAVVANADGAELDIDPDHDRAAVLGLMDEEGLVPSGAVGAGLLMPDPRAPFGVRYDEDAVVTEAREALSPCSMVLVEASDLVRADAYSGRASASQDRVQRTEALLATDQLVGRLLGLVDAEADAVVVVGPHPAEGSTDLTLAAVRRPGVEPGLMKSATTRRSGYVTTVDVAPALLDLIGADRPSSMEGRAFERSEAGGSFEDRVDLLAESDEAAQWRDGMVALVATLFVVVQLVLWAMTAVTLRQGGRRWHSATRHVAIAVLGVLPCTYLAGALPFHEWGALPYWAFLLGGGALLSWVSIRSLSRNAMDPLIATLSVVSGVILIDVLLGGRLQFNTVFGYTPTVAGRFAGVGNLAFAQIAAASTMLAGLVASRIRPPGGVRIALSLLVVTLVIDGSPFWGSDVGGVLTMVPVVGVMAVLMLGLRVRWATVALAGVAAVVATLAAGFLDLARPEASRTHLGRLFEDVGANGFEAFHTVVVRKVGANLSVITSSEWTLMLPIVFGFVLYLIWRAPGHLRTLQDVIEHERAARVGFIVAALLGFALNDSGIAVPGLMLGVMNASLVYLVVSVNAGIPFGREQGSVGDAGDRDPVATQPEGAQSGRR